MSYVDTSSPAEIAAALRMLADAIEALPTPDMGEILDALRSARDSVSNASSTASDLASSASDIESECSDAESSLDSVISDLESLS